MSRRKHSKLAAMLQTTQTALTHASNRRSCGHVHAQRHSCKQQRNVAKRGDQQKINGEHIDLGIGEKQWHWSCCAFGAEQQCVQVTGPASNCRHRGPLIMRIVGMNLQRAEGRHNAAHAPREPAENARMHTVALLETSRSSRRRYR